MQPQQAPNPPAAMLLEGMTLDGGWKVRKRLEKPLDATGGYFSCGYSVECEDGRKGFLKALDYSRAFFQTDKPISVALQELTESLNFEKYVLARCRDRRLDRVVISIADGTVEVGQPGIGTVEYLIFEFADGGDLRKQMSVVNNLDFLWRLKMLHHIATGLYQLHQQGIAHQDVKPSNVLVFGDGLSKLADFGRAACRGQHPPHEEIDVPGDVTYAPPELLYRCPDPDWEKRRFSCDAYLLGSMVVYLFTGQAMTALILSEMSHDHAQWQFYDGDFADIKPYLVDAFGRAIEKFSQHLPGKLAPHLVEIVRQLCTPDPERRGHPRERVPKGRQFSLERYRTTFDLLVKRAEVGLFGPIP